MSNINEQQNKFHDILERIERNELVLKPKTYFRLKFAILLAVLIALVVATLFLFSFIIFSLQAGGHLSLMGFGSKGWYVFLAFFPWKLTFLVIALIVFLEYLLRSFKFCYKVPVLYLLLGMLVLLSLCGLVIEKTRLHESLLGEADRHHLPMPFEYMYEEARRPPSSTYGIYRGVITAVSSTTYTVALDNPMGIGTTTIITVSMPNFHPPIAPKVGDRIFIQGEINNKRIDAIGIQSIN